jgi:hypothetical protein
VSVHPPRTTRAKAPGRAIKLTSLVIVAVASFTLTPSALAHSAKPSAKPPAKIPRTKLEKALSPSSKPFASASRLYSGSHYGTFYCYNLQNYPVGETGMTHPTLVGDRGQYFYWWNGMATKASGYRHLEWSEIIWGYADVSDGLVRWIWDTGDTINPGWKSINSSTFFSGLGWGVQYIVDYNTKQVFYDWASYGGGPC